VLDPFIDDADPAGSRSLQFYWLREPRPAGKDPICGGCGNVSGVADVIQSRVGITAEKGDRLAR
jgi:type IV pilus assembly protein PilM